LYVKQEVMGRTYTYFLPSASVYMVRLSGTGYK